MPPVSKKNKPKTLKIDRNKPPGLASPSAIVKMGKKSKKIKKGNKCGENNVPTTPTSPTPGIGKFVSVNSKSETMGKPKISEKTKQRKAKKFPKRDANGDLSVGSILKISQSKPKQYNPTPTTSKTSDFIAAKISNKSLAKKRPTRQPYDVIKANRGVVLIQHIPHGFYEDQMNTYFNQFGEVTRLHLARSQRTGRSKGYAFIEFRYPEIAQIAAETMDNYLMFKKNLKATYIPPEKQNPHWFRKNVTILEMANGRKVTMSNKTKQLREKLKEMNQNPTDEQHEARVERSLKKLKLAQSKYNKFGLDFNHIIENQKSNPVVVKLINKEESEKVKIPKGKKAKEKMTEEPISLASILSKTISDGEDESDDDFIPTDNDDVSLSNLLGHISSDDSSEDFDFHPANAEEESTSSDESDEDDMIESINESLDDSIADTTKIVESKHRNRHVEVGSIAKLSKIEKRKKNVPLKKQKKTAVKLGVTELIKTQGILKKSDIKSMKKKK